MIGTQFNAGEAGRGFREALASNQNLFGQNLASNQFNAGEAQRGFANRMGSENQFFNQRMAGDQFQAGQSQFRDQFGAQQQQQGFQNQMSNQQLLAQRDQFGAQQGQQQFQNQFGNNQFLAQQQGNQFNQDLRRRGVGAQERLLERQLPQQELAQIMQMMGVTNPQFQQGPQYGPMGVNYGGMVQDQYGQDLQAWQQGITRIGWD